MISPTLKKLRYRAGLRAYVVGAPAGFEAQMAKAPEVERRERLGRNLDVVQAFITRKSELERQLPRLRQALGERGILWICYPKASALGTDLNRDVIRAMAGRAGLQAVALVAIDPVWSALRCKRTPVERA